MASAMLRASQKKKGSSSIPLSPAYNASLPIASKAALRLQMDQQQEESWWIAIRIIVRIIISILGIAGNGLVIYVILKSAKLRDNTIKLIANLSVSDLVTAVLLPTSSILIKILEKPFYGCLMSCLVIHYTIFVSQFTLCITTFDRYFAICQHDNYSKIMTKKTIITSMVISWVIPLCLVSIPFLGLNIWENVGFCFCYSVFYGWVYKLYSAVVIVLVTVTVVLYTKILIKAMEFYSGFRPAQTTGINIASMRVRAKKRAIKNGKVIGIVTFVFIICWMPYHILQFRFGAEYVDMNNIAAITGALGTFNFVVNPFLYAWQRRDFRKYAKKLPCNLFGKWKNEKMKSGPNGIDQNSSDLSTQNMRNKKNPAVPSKDHKTRKQEICSMESKETDVKSDFYLIKNVMDDARSGAMKREAQQLVNYI